MFSRAPIVVLAAAALAGIWLGAATDGSSPPQPAFAGAPGADCRNFTGTPTATGTPTPSPPFTPHESAYVCNNTALAASDLHIVLLRAAVNESPLDINAPGCPDPAYSYPGGSPSDYTVVDIDWSAPCVDPGERVHVDFDPGCSTPEPGCAKPTIDCFYWTAEGTSVPTATFAINPRGCPGPTPTPAPPCDPPPTPPVTRVPTAKPESATFTPGPTERDAPFSATLAFCNNSGQVATDLHIHMDDPFSTVQIVDAPDGCPEPIIRPTHRGLDEFELHIDWRAECVRPNDSATLSMYFLCGSPCQPPEPYCYTWTKWGEQLDSEGACLPPVERVWGDFACNGDVNSLDVLRIFQHLAAAGSARPDCPKINEPLISNGEHVRWGDATCNSILDESDAVLLLRHIAQLVAQPNSFVCGGFGLTVKISPY